MSASPDYSHFVKTDAEGRSRLDLAIDGITCAACLDDIETAMKRLPGVMLARLNLTSHRLALTFDAATIDAGRLTGALESIGYRAYPFEQRKVEADEAARFSLLLKCLGVGLDEMRIVRRDRHRRLYSTTKALRERNRRSPLRLRSTSTSQRPPASGAAPE